jgi:hypothetical protein
MANRTFIQTNQENFPLKYFLETMKTLLKFKFIVFDSKFIDGVVKKSLKRKWSFLI